MGRLTQNQMVNTKKFLEGEFMELIASIGRIEDKDDYWDEVCRLTEECYQKTGRKLFNKLMIYALMDFIDIQYKLMRDKNLEYVDMPPKRIHLKK